MYLSALSFIYKSFCKVKLFSTSFLLNCTVALIYSFCYRKKNRKRQFWSFLKKTDQLNIFVVFQWSANRLVLELFFSLISDITVEKSACVVAVTKLSMKVLNSNCKLFKIIRKRSVSALEASATLLDAFYVFSNVFETFSQRLFLIYEKLVFKFQWFFVLKL